MELMSNKGRGLVRRQVQQMQESSPSEETLKEKVQKADENFNDKSSKKVDDVLQPVSSKVESKNNQQSKEMETEKKDQLVEPVQKQKREKKRSTDYENQEAQIKLSKRTKYQLGLYKQLYSNLKYDYEVIDFIIDRDIEASMSKSDREYFKLADNRFND